jgi:N-methylhydantoinase A/oxoprolinase/acetone carboxylase beta subunit
MSALMLGVDTGGTYTDGVLLDYEERRVLATTKTPTTHQNLQACILTALDELLPQDPTEVRLVAISTTLATNAIAEGKGHPVGLLLLGYDPDLAARFRFERRYATRYLAYLDGGHDLTGSEAAPLDLEGVANTADEWKGKVDALAVSGYFSPFNPSHEEAAAERIAAEVDLPVVLGHQLSSRLNSVERATTAALNGALIPILREFVEAMRAALNERQIEAPLMVLRGDGAMAPAAAAAVRPVETVHSGPAASAIGGGFLSGADRGLVVDIGGTTTDLAVLDGGRVKVREEGTLVGGYRTAVRAVDVRSIGLGGDSLIGLDAEDQLVVGPERVMPLSQLAWQHPEVAADLAGRAHRLVQRPSPDSIEYWFLLREPRRTVENDLGRQAIQLLRRGPRSLPALMERLGIIHPIQCDGPRLVREGVIGRSALTPTDLLHITGEFDRWHVQAAEIGVSFIAALRGLAVEDFIMQVKRWMAERIVAEIVSHISGQDVERSPYYVGPQDLGGWLFDESLHPQNPYLKTVLRLDMPVIGIGAPAGIFLPPVAEMFHTELVLPPHFEVANAVGAVAGSVMVEKEAWILPQLRNLHLAGYYSQVVGERRRFGTLEAALESARRSLTELAEAELIRAGVTDPVLEFERLPDGAESYRLRVRAVGNPML